MNFPEYFADANSNFDEADFVIFGIPYDITSSFRRGASQAPNKIRQSSWNFETFNLKNNVDFKDINVHDYGNIDVIEDSPISMIKKVKKISSMLLKKNKIPVALGGEHSITPGIIKAFPEDIGILSLDAHIDFRHKYENQEFNHACTIKRISDHVDIGDIAVFGVRSAEKEEIEEAEKQGLFWIDSFNIRRIGIEESINKVKKHLKNKEIYLTLDIDVFDPAFAPGASTPEPFGLTPFDILEVIESFSKQLVGFDVVEVCPPYDNGETAFLAARFIKYIIEEMWLDKYKD
jgi:agmatinase